MTMKHIMIIIVSVFLVMIFSAGANAEQQIIMKIEGMTCRL